MSVTIYRIEVTLKNGKLFRCEYSVYEWPGTYWDPAESETSEPTYYLDFKEVDVNHLPKGLDVIADDLYENNGSRFDATVTTRSPARNYDEE